MKVSLSFSLACLRRSLPVLLVTGFGIAAPAVVSAESKLASVCQSDPASIRAMLEDPLLADFFEMTCGAKAVDTALKAASQAPQTAVNPQGPGSPQGQLTFQDPSPANQNRSVLPEIPARQMPAERKPALDPQLIDQPEPALVTDSQKPEGQAVFSKFRFEGQIQIGQDDLAGAVSPLMGKPITRDRLVQLTQALAKTYRDLGWLVSIHLPDQDVSEGKVTVQIKEARFTGLEITDPQGVLRNTDLPERIVQDIQPVGAPVNLEAIKKAQTRLNEIPGVSAQLNLKKGASDSETQGVVQVEPDKPVDVSISADNSGPRSTGRGRVIGGLTLNNPTRRGDQFSAQLMASEGLKYFAMSYSLPVTNQAWRLGLRMSSMNYSLVANEYAGLDAKGPTQSAGVFLQIPWLKTPRDSVRFDANLTTNRYKHELNAATYSRYTSDLLSMGWVANTMSLLPGSNQTSMDMMLSRGRIDLSDSTDAHRVADAATLRTEGYFSKLKFGLAHRQFFTPQTSFLASVRGQWSDKNLDSSERFSLGGSGGVRAYPTSEASGSMGGIATLELQHQMPWVFGRFSLAGFYDYGEIKINESNSFAGASSPNGYKLQGYGLWLGAEMPSGDGLMGLRLTWARRSGENPGRFKATGLDQDGTLDKNRFWIDAYYRY